MKHILTKKDIYGSKGFSIALKKKYTIISSWLSQSLSSKLVGIINALLYNKSKLAMITWSSRYNKSDYLVPAESMVNIAIISFH